MNVEAMIGRECSLPIPGSTNRERGYVGELSGDDDLLVRLYPAQGTHFEERTLAPDAVRILKADPPAGWQEIEVLTENGEPYVSLRLKRADAELLVQGAEQARMSVEKFFNQIIRTKLERRSALLNR